MDELQNQQNQNQPQWQQPQEPQIKENFINKKIIIIIAVVVALLLIILGVWIWRQNRYSTLKGTLKGDNVMIPVDNLPPQYQTKPSLLEDTTSAINNDLNSINMESIDDSFNEIDADLNNL